MVWVSVVFEMKGTSPSIHMDGGIKVVEITDYALSCKAGGD